MADKGKIYYLGLDIGTNSVGWAVTDENYNIIKKNGKALWGIRLFDEAKTAAERRTFRGGRRRLQRRKERITILQELFAEEISKVDMGFYQRLKESRLWEEDRSDNNKQTNTLFNDIGFSDKEYHKRYPTIYHLRSELIHNKEPHDVRLVYLAVHHILKHRGHFLFEGNKIDEILSIETAYYNFTQIMKDELDLEFSADIDELQKTLKRRESGITKKTAELQNVFAIDKKDKQSTAVIKLLAGAKGVKLSDIFKDEGLEEYELNKISFSESGSDEKLEQVISDQPDLQYVLASIKALYDWSVLAESLSGHQYISDAKIALYEKHKNDLRLLKGLIKRSYKGEYNRLFRDPESGANYCAYIGSYSVNGKNDSNSTPIKKRCSQEDFYAEIKKIIKSGNDEDTKYILSEIEKKTFLPLQVIKDNGVIPNQLHKMELQRILENASGYLSFLCEQDMDGLTAIDKICGDKDHMGLIDYRIPYYVGPINTYHKDKGFSWAEKKKNDEKVYPWNFYDVVDTEQSAEKFITRMTNKCTYLFGEDVLPKDSLLYSKFLVLNEINNITLNGEKISADMKQEIYDELFREKKKIKKKDLENFFIRKGYSDAVANDAIGGIDGDPKSSLSSYIDLNRLRESGDIKEADFERIIRYIVLFGEDKKLLRNRINNEFPYINKEQLKAICRLRYREWGRLSGKLLEGIAIPDTEPGETLTIIRHMWDTNDNLMQTLRSGLGFKEAIEEANKTDSRDREITYKDVDELYVSPKIKRPIWQTVSIVNELRDILKADPKRVFIEVTRSEDEKKERKSSRKELLIELYKNCKNEEKDWISEIEGRSEGEFRNNLLFLYYTQMGRDMYTGRPIDLDSLFAGNLYDKDHIWPRSKTKDDSVLNNLVLVNKIDNAKTKSDKYPVPAEIRKEMTPFWTMLYKKGFITKIKYERLIRSTEFEDEELAGFINRQLVETSQSNKAVAELLKRMFYQKADIVYSKAKNITEFRRDNKDKPGYLKARSVNDLHHAKDAYLNIVVGNVYHTKFTNDPLKYIKDSTYRSYSLNRVFDFKVERDGVTAWIPGENGTIATVDRWMKKNNILFTRQAYEVKGGFFDQNLMKKGKGQVRIKDNKSMSLPIEKYGGYNKAAGAYFILVRSKTDKGYIKTIEPVPVYLAGDIEKGRLSLEEYCINYLGLNEPEVLVRKIKINSLFEHNGFRMHLSGRTENRLILKCGKQLCIPWEYVSYVKKIEKFIDDRDARGITEEENIKLYDLMIDLLKNTRYGVRLSAQIETLEQKRDRFEALPLNEQVLVLNEVLKLFQCKAISADLSRIGGPKSAGIIVQNNNVSKTTESYIVSQSITGLFEKKIDISEL